MGDPELLTEAKKYLGDRAKVMLQLLEHQSTELLTPPLASKIKLDYQLS